MGPASAIVCQPAAPSAGSKDSSPAGVVVPERTRRGSIQALIRLTTRPADGLNRVICELGARALPCMHSPDRGIQEANMSIPKPDDSDYEDEATTARLDLLSGTPCTGGSSATGWCPPPSGPRSTRPHVSSNRPRARTATTTRRPARTPGRPPEPASRTPRPLVSLGEVAAHSGALSSSSTPNGSTARPPRGERASYCGSWVLSPVTSAQVAVAGHTGFTPILRRKSRSRPGDLAQFCASSSRTTPVPSSPSSRPEAHRVREMRPSLSVHRVTAPAKRRARTPRTSAAETTITTSRRTLSL